jgi:hypothetical protein
MSSWLPIVFPLVMADLIAQGPEFTHRWRRTLRKDQSVMIGRQSGLWSTPWDDRISRQHICACWNGAVLVIDLTLVDHGHGLEAAVRMPAHAARLGGGREVRRAGVVEQQERRKLGMTPVVEHCVHREAVADPVPLGLAMDAEDVFHGG